MGTMIVRNCAMGRLQTPPGPKGSNGKKLFSCAAGLLTGVHRSLTIWKA